MELSTHHPRGPKLCSPLVVSQHFMEPEGSILRSQELTTCTCTGSIQSILMLSIHLHIGLPSGLFPSGFRTNNLYAFLFSPIHATCPTHLITMFTRAHHLHLSNARSIQSSLMLSNHLQIGLHSGLFPSGFPTNNLHTFLFSPFTPHAPPTSSSST
jgi:hypothetical protein